MKTKRMTKIKQVRCKDLKNQLGTPDPRPILLCNACGQEYSANSGDYWNVDPDYVFKHCGKNMRLVIKKIVYVD